MRHEKATQNNSRAQTNTDSRTFSDYGFFSWPEPGVGSFLEVQDKTLDYESTLTWAEKIPKLFWRGALMIDLRKEFVDIASEYSWGQSLLPHCVCDIADAVCRRRLVSRLARAEWRIIVAGRTLQVSLSRPRRGLGVLGSTQVPATVSERRRRKFSFCATLARWNEKRMNADHGSRRRTR